MARLFVGHIPLCTCVIAFRDPLRITGTDGLDINLMSSGDIVRLVEDVGEDHQISMECVVETFNHVFDIVNRRAIRWEAVLGPIPAQPQEFRVYNTYTDSDNVDRAPTWDEDGFVIGEGVEEPRGVIANESDGTGTTRDPFDAMGEQFGQSMREDRDRIEGVKPDRIIIDDILPVKEKTSEPTKRKPRAYE